MPNTDKTKLHSVIVNGVVFNGCRVLISQRSFEV